MLYYCAGTLGAEVTSVCVSIVYQQPVDVH